MRFAEIIGQEDVKMRLIRSAKEGRISHAQLFLGPEGGGAFALAAAYIQYILCEKRSGSDSHQDDSCGSCAPCLKIAKLSHPDVHLSFPVILSESKTSDGLIAEFRERILETPYMNYRYWLDSIEGNNKNGVIGVDESAGILHKLVYKAYEAEYKFMLVWMAEHMNTQAANKLLKIIEEPPEKTVFILIAEDTEEILPTILSRCQVVKIPRLPDEHIENALVEKGFSNKEEAKSIATLAEGNFWEAQKQITQLEENLERLDTFRQWMLFCFKKDVPGIIQFTDDLSGGGREKLKILLSYSLNMFRQSIIANYGGNEMVHLRGNEREFIVKFANYIHGSNIIELTEAFDKAYYYLERNGNPKIVMFDLSLTAMKLINKQQVAR
jgi:DNA polymerase-3 subunit delta'